MLERTQKACAFREETTQHLFSRNCRGSGLKGARTFSRPVVCWDSHGNDLQSFSIQKKKPLLPEKFGENGLPRSSEGRFRSNQEPGSQNQYSNGRSLKNGEYIYILKKKRKKKKTGFRVASWKGSRGQIALYVFLHQGRP